ncbi:4-hydroxy-3-methylbut-2-enyl diphosphate reductase [Balneolaceae bacterium ANBcel3]|nr:4-hydroxy-3-methylbut-2-enyl diphosphate reductase [Balneolaceae bacterium ANBcel3]
MSREFTIPDVYQSKIIRPVKQKSQILDPRKKKLDPVLLDFGPVRFYIPRHFGFCYGVENAIDIAYRTVENNPGKRIFLLSEMIHNPMVNNDLRNRGVEFLFNTDGTERIPLSSLTPDDIVIVPAFGTSIEVQQQIEQQGVDPYQYDTTCPFVVKVWKRGQQLGKKGYSLVIHGKHEHEETRATFSHTSMDAPCVIVRNPEEARILADIITGKRDSSDFERLFRKKSSDGFDPFRDLRHFGVINQTTMLATETQEVMSILKSAVDELNKGGDPSHDFADTADTLCYATNENQFATYALMKQPADLALVIGGYNSSNTKHLVELLEQAFPTYHISDANQIISHARIRHFDQWKNKVLETPDWLPSENTPVTIALSSGASCPDTLVDEVILKVIGLFNDCYDLETVLAPFKE